jgi:hypothetical protein
MEPVLSGVFLLTWGQYGCYRRVVNSMTKASVGTPANARLVLENPGVVCEAHIQFFFFENTRSLQ